MDETAIIYSDTNSLKKLGIKTEGDAIRLKVLCSNGYDGLEEKKKRIERYNCKWKFPNPVFISTKTAKDFS